MNEKQLRLLEKFVYGLILSTEFRRRMLKEIEYLLNAGGEYITYHTTDLQAMIIISYKYFFGAYCQKTEQRTVIKTNIDIFIFEPLEKQEKTQQRIFFAEDLFDEHETTQCCPIIPTEEAKREKFSIGIHPTCFFASSCPKMHECRLTREVTPQTEFETVRKYLREKIEMFLQKIEKEGQESM